MNAIEFLPANHAVQRINAEARAGLVRAQHAVISRAFPDPYSFCGRVLDDLRLSIPVPDELRDKPVADISDISFAGLRAFWAAQIIAADIPEDAAALHALNLAQHSQLVRSAEPRGTLGSADRIGEKQTSRRPCSLCR